MKRYAYIFCLLIFTFSVGCVDSVPTPKPRAYPKIEFPLRAYTSFNSEDCPFTFEHPTYATVELSEGRENNEKEKCWYDIHYTKFNAKLHLSYFQIKDDAHFSKLLKDAFVIADKINIRSNYMDELKVQNEYGVGGLVMEFSGPAASPMQFFLTDSTQNFIKAALYFNSKVIPDSIAPIAEFVKGDVAQTINSFQFK